MSESPLRKFCESRHRKLIVIIVTTLFGLLVLIPLVDDYFNKKESHATLTDDLDRAREIAKQLPEVENQVAEIVSKLDAIESRSIDNETVSRYRNKMVEFVRDAGCQVRRFDVATPTMRPWLQKDDPLEAANAKDKKSKRTPFQLERRSVVLLVDGPMENLQLLLSKLNKDDSLAYLRRLELQSNARGSEQVTLEIEMWLFALGRQKA